MTSSSTIPLALIGCGKRKVSFSTKAERLYTGPFFTACLRYAKIHHPNIAILSAKYGLTQLTDLIAPYDQSLLSMSPAERSTWGVKVRSQILQRYGKHVRLIYICGKVYRESVGLPGDVIIPEGLGMGEQMRFLTLASKPKQRTLL